MLCARILVDTYCLSLSNDFEVPQLCGRRSNIRTQLKLSIAEIRKIDSDDCDSFILRLKNKLCPK
jgi:hypothetical protein